MKGSRTLSALAGLLVALYAVGPAEARAVRRCGITIERGKVGRLARDVQCGWYCAADPTVRCIVDAGGDVACPLSAPQSCQPDSIVLEANATLDLNGFQLTAVYGETAVYCVGKEGKCTVRGPGLLLGGKSAVPIAPGSSDLSLKDLTIRRFYRMITTPGVLRADGVKLEYCEGGLRGESGVQAKDIELEDRCGLYSGKHMTVDGIDSAGAFGAARTLRAHDATIRYGSLVTGSNVVLSNSRAVPRTSPDEQSGIEIQATGKVVLRKSSVGGVASGEGPRLVDSTCQRSVKPDGTSTWGVCTGD